MNCQEAERLVTPYIHGELDEDTLEKFLEHIETCENCQEELEIYFTVDSGIRQLDSDADNYNIKGELEELLDQSRKHVRRRRMLHAMRYSVDTLMAVSYTHLGTGRQYSSYSSQRRRFPQFYCPFLW